MTRDRANRPDAGGESEPRSAQAGSHHDELSQESMSNRGLTASERHRLEVALTDLQKASYEALLAGDCATCSAGGSQAFQILAMLRGQIPFYLPSRDHYVRRMYEMSRWLSSSPQTGWPSCSPTCEFQAPPIASVLAKWKRAAEELTADPDAELAESVRASAKEMEPDDPRRARLLQTQGLSRKERDSLQKGRADLCLMGLEAANKANDAEFFYAAIWYCQVIDEVLEGNRILEIDRIPQDGFEWAEAVRSLIAAPGFADSFEKWRAEHADAPAWKQPPGVYTPD